MTRSEEIIGSYEEYVMKTYSRFPLVLSRGEGVWVWDAEGRRYLDFVSGLAVNSLGHCHPAVVQAVMDQARTLIHCSNLYYTENQAELARLLVESSPFQKAFFCNSGAEANEAAIKLARKYAKANVGPGAHEIITAHQSFHGRTLATVAATGQEKYQKGFEPLTKGFVHVPYNDLKALCGAITETTCAVMLEVIQGEGGINVAAPGYLEGVRRVCSENGLLLIIDEVQTGLGRTGKMFAFEHYGIEPDIVTLAKALGGGVAIGALLARDDVASAFEPGSHASTFGGNPLACAAAIAFLKVLRENSLIENSRIMGQYFAGRLAEMREIFPAIKEIRGKGLMIGLEFEVPVKDLVMKCMALGLLTCSAGPNVLRFLPPLTVSRVEIDEALAIFNDALAAICVSSLQVKEALNRP